MTNIRKSNKMMKRTNPDTIESVFYLLYFLIQSAGIFTENLGTNIAKQRMKVSTYVLRLYKSV